MALALSQGAPSMRMGHMIYTNKLVNGAHPLPPMLTTGAPATGPPGRRDRAAAGSAETFHAGIGQWPIGFRAGTGAQSSPYGLRQ